jgi:hypothetical protein
VVVVPSLPAFLPSPADSHTRKVFKIQEMSQPQYKFLSHLCCITDAALNYRLPIITMKNIKFGKIHKIKPMILRDHITIFCSVIHVCHNRILEEGVC